MTFREWIGMNEMPIRTFDLQGDWNPANPRKYGYTKQDVGILNNPAGVEKIHKLWSNSKNTFDLYFIKSKDAYKHVEVGEVSPQWVKENLKVDIEPKPDAITIIFTNNVGDQKVPMTAWIIAHRLGHAIRRTDVFNDNFAKEITRDFYDLANQVYGIEKGSDIYERNTKLRPLALALGTMRSARKENLRNFNELAYELVAQYITTGKITFAPIPASLITRRRFAWGNPAHDRKYTKLKGEELTEWDEIVKGYAGKYEYYLDNHFDSLEGKMFVM